MEKLVKEGERELPTIFFPDRRTVKDTRLGPSSSPEEGLSSLMSILGQCFLVSN